MGTTQAANALGLSPRTLRSWRQQHRAAPWTPKQRGRTAVPCDVPTRNEVIHFLHTVTGPSVGLPALCCLFPHMRRCVLQELLTKYRRVWRRRYVQRGFRLSWHHAGAVWAMDHSEPKHPVDGVYPYLLAVRDLASSRQLAWHPVKTVSAEETLPVLDALMQEHGAPLVLKSDNGSAFIAESTCDAMREQDVAQLFSPPRWPSYNGALERSNGVLKTYTHQHALAEGHPFRWTSEDLQHAMQLANTISRPWGHRGPTPEEAWQAREAIDAEQRANFRAVLARHRAQAAEDLGLDDHEVLLASKDRARRDRLALSRTLEELGYLTLQRVRRPPKKPPRPNRDELQRRISNQKEDADASTSKPTQTLAPPALLATMHARTARCNDDGDRHPAAQTDTSTHRKWTISSWTRRCITLLVMLAKAANIMR